MPATLLAPEVTTTPRGPSGPILARLVAKVNRWASTAGGTPSIHVYIHPNLPTIRFGVVAATRPYDRVIDDSLSELDQGFATDDDFSMLDLEFRLFFAVTLEQLADWARGWEPWTDA